MPALSTQPSIFFFQAEDGIRDHCVTGVQTCALPIFVRMSAVVSAAYGVGLGWRPDDAGCVVEQRESRRSEERRVGKECRSRWARDSETKTERSQSWSCGMRPGRS